MDYLKIFILFINLYSGYTVVNVQFLLPSKPTPCEVWGGMVGGGGGGCASVWERVRDPLGGSLWCCIRFAEQQAKLETLHSSAKLKNSLWWVQYFTLVGWKRGSWSKLPPHQRFRHSDSVIRKLFTLNVCECKLRTFAKRRCREI